MHSVAIGRHEINVGRVGAECNSRGHFVPWVANRLIVREPNQGVAEALGAGALAGSR